MIYEARHVKLRLCSFYEIGSITYAYLSSCKIQSRIRLRFFITRRDSSLVFSFRINHAVRDVSFSTSRIKFIRVGTFFRPSSDPTLNTILRSLQSTDAQSGWKTETWTGELDSLPRSLSRQNEVTQRNVSGSIGWTMKKGKSSHTRRLDECRPTIGDRD